MNTKPDTLDRVQLIQRAHDAGEGSIANLCKQHKMSAAYFYTLRKNALKTKKPKTQKKRAARFLDIPLAPANHTYKLRIFEVECAGEAELVRLMGNFK